jgi:hypothetical protein
VPSNPQTPADPQTDPNENAPLSRLISAAVDAPWYVKTPGSRPDQSSIVIKQEQIISRQGKDFVLYAGLLDAAHKAGLQGIRTFIVQCPSPTNGGSAVVHATVEFGWGSFTGIGDADDGNVSRNIAPHKVRMAETRAKARALRDALNIGMVALEEMGPDPGDAPTKAAQAQPGHDRGFDAPLDGTGTAAPRPVAGRSTGPVERKTYGTPLTKPAVQ